MTNPSAVATGHGRQRIAVVGSGVAGLTCAHVLGPHHDVVLFEAAPRLGGHANTVDVPRQGAEPLAVDTGFIVHNDRNYSNFVALMEELGVETVDTEMSFGVTDHDPTSPTHGFTYRATSPNTLFADRRNLVRPAMWRMLREIPRFYRAARAFLADDPAGGEEDELTLADFLALHGFGRELVELHLVPMGAAVWSADPSRFAEFPARSLFRFLDHHGLLSVGDRPQWRTIPGGSRVYVEAIAARFPGEIRLATPVRQVRRVPGEQTVEVVTEHGVDVFDRVVLATHSDQSLAMIADPTPSEQKVLGAVGYQPNRATLHSDVGLLPPFERAWAAWNYERLGPDQRAATLTYDMTELQHLPGPGRHLVTLNGDDRIDPETVVASFDYAHPVFDTAAIEAQRRFDEIDGADRIHFCGAWWGYGFHEDGMVSALRVCHRIGVHWPHSTVGGEPNAAASRSTTAADPPPVTDDRFEPGDAAVCDGAVVHRRTRPAEHRFRYDVAYAWLDPDDPAALTRQHPLWSSRLPAPVRFRRRDYGQRREGSLAEAARDDLATVLPERPTGPVRMLSQLRRWGWLFNPITVYVVWADDTTTTGPCGVVLEVTNTPWKERHRYAVALERDGAWWRGSTDKRLHVSPFLDEEFVYEVRIRRSAAGLQVGIDVLPATAGEDDDPILRTDLSLGAVEATRSAMTSSMLRRPLSTHRVSLGIHWQALRLWLRRVPFVPHPTKRADQRVAVAGSDAMVHAERLLAHAEAPHTSTRADRVAARAGRFVLDLTRHERLVVHDRIAGRRPVTRTVGSRATTEAPAHPTEVSAEVVVHDERAYAALVREGSIGFGRGYVEGWWTSDDPVAVVRFAIRNLGGLDRLRNRLHRLTGPVGDAVRRALPRDSRERNREDIGAHYDIGNAFFELFLDETMTYSSAVFPSLAAGTGLGDTSLADASRHKYDLLLDRLGLTADQHLLEIGTGWGGLALRAAGERGARVTTTTISSEQLAEARRRVEAAGLTDRVTLLDDDWRDLTGTFDRLVSIEMIEAVDWRDYDDFFAQIERRLASGGRAALQAICLPDDRWERAKNTEDFIRRFVFPNGFLPSVAAIRASVERATSMQVVEVADYTEHYAETLRRWRETFERRIDEVAALGLDERFQRLWRFYFAYCEAGFRERHIRLVQIVIA